MSFNEKMIKKYGKPSWLPEKWEYKPCGKNKKPVYGVGINDIEFACQPTLNGKRVMHPAYVAWTGMLERSYSDKYKKRYPTYQGVYVDDNWLTFSNFFNWFNDHYIDGYSLDKDLLVENNKIYSEITCAFIPTYINSFLTLHNADRGSLPIGVTKYGKNFQASICKDNIRIYLGTFKTPEMAHKEWQKAKLAQAIAFDNILLTRVINKLTYQISNGIETTSL